MRLSHVVAASTYIASAAAGNCCWTVNWGDVNWLYLTWDEPAGVVRCGLEGNIMPGSHCKVENSKDDDGNVQALTSVTFGVGHQYFKFRIGVQPGSCKPLPNDKVVTGWEDWGANLFAGSTFLEQRLEICNTQNSQ
ncbi:hypothetical protein CTRI78_v011467 [Colletotrichum trifolii]|uniref:Secreted protein n=1 Tax=Colletotrichum trifolii TaxID=5466 RepID=A0A4R8QAC1_COLTR|nr:hypothetical protein CTRI78_v011467 [Colletotrichum trifolii]